MSHDSVPEVAITVFPAGKSVACPTGARLHEVLARMRISLTTPCGGNGTCGKCLVEIAAKPSGDRRHDDHGFQQVRACQYVVREALEVRLSGESQLPDASQILTSHQPLDVPAGDAVPLTLAHLAADALANLPQDLTCPNGQYVVAVDIGTTTIVAELLLVQTRSFEDIQTNLTRSCGVLACRNPQAEFGDDVISRIQYASESPENADRLRLAVVDAINDLITSLADKVKQTGLPAPIPELVFPEQITLVVIAGNTTMQQLFAKVDVESLGHSPFDPATKHYPPTRADAFGLAINPSGLAVLFPVIGGFVGGDIVAGIVATQLCSQNAPSLLIDIGTNGEIVLWQPEGRRLLATATAAGPAFEGARISRGMIAAPGAIERVVLGDDLHVETIGRQPARGICGSGLIDLVAELVRIGAVVSSGKLLTGDQLPETVPLAIRDRFVTHENKPAFVIVAQQESARELDPGWTIDRPVRCDSPCSLMLTQHDIRQVQLAAGAIRAGVTLLLRRAGLEPGDLASVFLAGGFGNYIRRENAQRIGLLPPDIPTERIRFCGNTSLAGAKAVLLNTACYDAMPTIADQAECIDLSKSPDFSTVFAESMFFPTQEQSRERK